MFSLPIDRLVNSLGETLVMTAVSGAISLANGLPLGIILVCTSPREACGRTAGPTASAVW